MPSEAQKQSNMKNLAKAQEALKRKREEKLLAEERNKKRKLDKLASPPSVPPPSPARPPASGPMEFNVDDLLGPKPENPPVALPPNVKTKKSKGILPPTNQPITSPPKPKEPSPKPTPTPSPKKEPLSPPVMDKAEPPAQPERVKPPPPKMKNIKVQLVSSESSSSSEEEESSMEEETTPKVTPVNGKPTTQTSKTGNPPSSSPVPSSSVSPPVPKPTPGILDHPWAKKAKGMAVDMAWSTGKSVLWMGAFALLGVLRVLIQPPTPSGGNPGMPSSFHTPRPNAPAGMANPPMRPQPPPQHQTPVDVNSFYY
jgi:hypothetical protein